MTNFSSEGKLLRQAFPVGDVERGQYVQPGTVFPVKSLGVDWFDNEALTVSTTVKQLTQRLVGYDRVKIVVELAPVKFQLDDTDPTSTTGMRLEIGDMLDLDTVEEVKDIKFISANGVSATLRVFYGKSIVMSN